MIEVTLVKNRQAPCVVDKSDKTNLAGDSTRDAVFLKLWNETVGFSKFCLSESVDKIKHSSIFLS